VDMPEMRGEQKIVEKGKALTIKKEIFNRFV